MDRFTQIQVFYEIAMSIGNSLEMKKMLRRSFQVYMRKLGCCSGAVLQAHRDAHGALRLETVFSIPRHSGGLPIYQPALDHIPEAPEDSRLESLMSRLPRVGKVDSTNHYHFMNLPDFGILYLVKSNKPLNSKILKSLPPLNAKLASSCRACLQNDRVEKVVKERTRELSRANQELHVEIKERQRTEEALKEAKQSADQAKSDFLANMSHEIRTPLNGILGMTELMSELSMPDSQKDLLDTITTEANSLLWIINDVLDFSKIEAGKLELEAQPFDLREVMDELMASFSLKAMQKGLVLNTRLDPGLTAELIGDRGRLRQVLVNLVANALKFTNEGEVVVTAASLASDDRRTTIRFRVSDTGIGIPMEVQGSIFDSFTQADGSTTRKYGGTGLGTAISKQLVELMGGEIGVNSTPGKGSTFWFTSVFPVQEQAAPEDGEEAPKPEEGAPRAVPNIPPEGRRILLADDYPTNLKVAQAHLRSVGYHVDTAENGKQAYELFSRNSYDCVLMDVQMPEMDGYEAARRIRDYEEALRRESGGGHAASEIRRTPIIAMTAHALKKCRRECLDAGMDDFLTKPLRRNDLLAMVAGRLSSVAQEQAAQRGGRRLPEPHPQGEDSENRPPIDYETALEEFLGDAELLREVIEGFMCNAGKQLTILRRAVADGNMSAVCKEAHAIKGGAANLAAKETARLASELEELGLSGRLRGGSEILDRMEAELTALKVFLKLHMPEPPDFPEKE